MKTNVVSTHTFDPEEEALRIEDLSAHARHQEMLAEHAHRREERQKRHRRGISKCPIYCLK